MTTARRAYINPRYDQYVDDGCLEYKSIAMAVVRDLIKVQHYKNDFDGIKQVYNLIPPRPKDINTMAVSIARINNLPYNLAVPEISKKVISEEITDVNSFVRDSLETMSVNQLLDFMERTGYLTQPQETYIAEQPSQSSSGVRLVPSQPSPSSPIRSPSQDLASVILGDVEPSSGVNIESQTEWFKSKQQGYELKQVKFGVTPATAENVRGSLQTQTSLTKPPMGRYLPKDSPTAQMSVFENPRDRFGTITGTPTGRLSSPEQVRRVFGEHYTQPTRSPLSADSAMTSGAPSGMTSGEASGMVSGQMSPQRPMGDLN